MLCIVYCHQKSILHWDTCGPDLILGCPAANRQRQCRWHDFRLVPSWLTFGDISRHTPTWFSLELSITDLTEPGTRFALGLREGGSSFETALPTALMMERNSRCDL